MKIITYNVNGLRSALSKGFTDWLAKEQPDIVCLQETKAQPDQIPTLEFEILGYRSFFFSAQKKGYSGVAILTKKVPDHLEYGIGIPEYDNEGRFLRADYDDLSVVSVYHPSGTTGDIRQTFKMKWLEDFRLTLWNSVKPILNLFSVEITTFATVLLTFTIRSGTQTVAVSYPKNANG